MEIKTLNTLANILANHQAPSLALAAILALGLVLPLMAETTIAWGSPKAITRGAYARIRQLQDGRYACVYELGGNAYIRFAKDPLSDWSKATLVASGFTATRGAKTTANGGKSNAKDSKSNANGENSAFVYLANAEFIQLKSGRLLYGVNLRTVKQRYDLHPSAIGVTVSDDRGATWSPLKIVYRAPVTNDGIRRGCWEPYFLELPNGTVQLYFANEAPYTRGKHKYQEITVMDSRDGVKWERRRAAAYAAGCRDGMPVAIIDGKSILLALESNPPGCQLFPQLVRTSVTTPWRQPVGSHSSDRCLPLANGTDFRKTYAGAPYLIATANHLALSWQQAGKTANNPAGTQSAHLAIAPRGAFGNRTFAGDFTPPDFDGKPLYWNSLCPLAGDSFLLVSQCQGHIYVTPGTITSNTKSKVPKPI